MPQLSSTRQQKSQWLLVANQWLYSSHNLLVLNKSGLRESRVRNSRLWVTTFFHTLNSKTMKLKHEINNSRWSGSNGHYSSWASECQMIFNLNPSIYLQDPMVYVTWYFLLEEFPLFTRALMKILKILLDINSSEPRAHTTQIFASLRANRRF